MRIAMRNALALTVGLVTLGGCSSHVVVRPVTGQPLKEAGAYYALPRTEITVELTIEGKITRSGTYAAWAEPLLGVDNVLLEKAKAAEEDQLALLTREKDILKAMKEIRDLREALGQAGEAEAEQP